MFKSLKERLKKAVGLFSKRAEKEAKIVEEKIVEREEKILEPKIEKKQEFKTKVKKPKIKPKPKPELKEKKEAELKEKDLSEKRETVKKLPLTRDQAFELVKRYNKDTSDLNHFLETEVIMRALARRLGEDEEYWGMLGLLHDIDWGLTKSNPLEHLTKAPQILKEAGFDDNFIEGVISHGYGFPCAGLEDKKRTKKFEYALACAETVTGLIHAYSLMRGTIEGMKVKGLKKKFKDKSFAAGVRRDIIKECEKMGLELDEFLGLAIDAVKEIADKVGLKKVKKEAVKEELEEIKERDKEIEEEKPEIKEKPKRILGMFKKKTEDKQLSHEELKVLKEKKPEIIKEEVIEKPKAGLFKKIKEKITLTQLSEEKFEELFWELEVALLENNVAVEVIEKIKNDLKVKLTSTKIPKKNIEGQILSSLKESISSILSIDGFNLIEKIKSSPKPYKIMFLGVNGGGKTTTLAKIAKMLRDNGLTVVVAAADTFRAAAIDQLKEHCDRIGVKMITQGYNADPAAVAFDAVKHAEAKKIDVVLIDTAGRLHSNVNLMAELQKINRVAKPNLKLFVGESITGNDCVEQAKQFDEMVGIDAIILTKADIDEKGGAPLSISYVTKRPILYIGVGQSYNDLKSFNKNDIMQSIGLA